MSNVRSLPLSSAKVYIGDETIDRQAEREAEHILSSHHPELRIITTPNGKKQIALQDIMHLERRFMAEKEAAEKTAFDRGRQAGYAAGLTDGQRDARQVIASFSGLLSDVTAQRHAILSEAKSEILELVLKISKRLTFASVEINPEITQTIIIGAIDQLLDKSRIKVKVNPRHFPELERYIDRFRGRDTAIKEFALEPDPRVRSGGCFIETPAGDIDARLESMYEVISQAILGGEEKPE